MAKDPATLWYWNDWHSGTILMSRFLKGCYIDLLHAQFNHGPLSLDDIKAVLQSDFGQAWPILVKKFSEKEGMYFNERLENEKERRKNFIEKQSSNGKRGGRKPKQNPTLNPRLSSGLTNIENETEDETENISFGKFENLLSEIEIGATVEYVAITGGKTLLPHEVEEYWKAFLIHSKGKFYQGRSDKLQHFRTWLKNLIINLVKNEAKPGTSEARIIAANDF